MTAATMASSAMEAASPSMKAASSMGAAAKAALSPEGVASRNTAMVKPTEAARMCACHWVRAGGSMKSFMPAKSSAGPMVEVRSTRMKTVAVDNGPAVRDVRVVVVDDSPVVVPIVSPMVPAPAEAAK